MFVENRSPAPTPNKLVEGLRKAPEVATPRKEHVCCKWRFTVPDPMVLMLVLVLMLMLYLQSFACTDVFFLWKSVNTVKCHGCRGPYTRR
jgi:hypothetical protein